MTEIEKAIKEYDILIKGYEDDLLSDRYSDIVKEEFKRQRDIFLIGREALKEKAEMEKGCDFCNVEYTVMSGSRMNSDLIHKGCAAKFCPNCGKRLVSEE